jgi:uncharacterized protein
MPGSNGTTPAIRYARPTIVLDGLEKPRLTLGLLDLTIVEHTSGLYRCEARFGNWGTTNNAIGYLYFDRVDLDFGKRFSVRVDQVTLFDGRITAIEGNFPAGEQSSLTVLAEDRLQDLRMTRRTRTFTNISEADLVNQIAAEHGLSPRVELPGPTHKVLAQLNQSDLALLRERARTIGGEIWVDGQTLHATARARRNGGTLKLEYGDKLRAFSAVADLAQQRTSVAVSGWDVSSKVAVHEEASADAIADELNGDISGVSILQSALGKRKEALAHTVPFTGSAAQAEAEAFFRMSARRFVVGHGSADTDAQLRVGSYVNLHGLGPLFSGKYYLAEVQHIFDGAQGLRTEFVGERPGIGQAL